MANKNDDKILELKQQIEEMQKELKGKKKFSPVTNCILQIDGHQYNINVLNENELKLLLLKVQSLLMAADSMDVEDTYGIKMDNVTLCGYPIEDWKLDILNRLSVMNARFKSQMLDEKTKELDKLLSEGRRTKIAIDEIESFLKS